MHPKKSPPTPDDILSNHVQKLSRKRKSAESADMMPMQKRKREVIVTTANIMRSGDGMQDSEVLGAVRTTNMPVFQLNGSRDNGTTRQQEASGGIGAGSSMIYIMDDAAEQFSDGSGLAAASNGTQQNGSSTTPSASETPAVPVDADNEVLVFENPIVDANLCTICLDPMHTHGKHKITSTPCGHCFGYECIVSWINKGKNQCPICKAPITSDRLVPLFLVESVHPLVAQHHARELRDQVQCERRRWRQQKSLSKRAIQNLDELRDEIQLFLRTGTFPGQQRAVPASASASDVIEVIDSDDEMQTPSRENSTVSNDDCPNAAMDFLLHLQRKMEERVEPLKRASLRLAQDPRKKFRPHLEFDLKTRASFFDFCGHTGDMIVYDSKCSKDQKQAQLTWFSTVANREQTITFPELSVGKSTHNQEAFRFVDLRGGMIPQNNSPIVACATVPDNRVRLIDIHNSKNVLEFTAPYEPSTLCFSNTTGNYMYVGTEIGSVIELDLRRFGEVLQEIRLPSHDYHRDQPVTSIEMMPNGAHHVMCTKGASGLFALNFNSAQFSCHAVTFPTLKRRQQVFYNFNVAYNGLSNLWSTSFVSHRSTQVSIDSLIFEMPALPSSGSKDDIVITSDTKTKHPPVLLQVPSFNFPNEKHPTIMQQTGYEPHDLRIPILFDSESWDHSSGKYSPFIAVAQNRNVLLYDCNEGHVVQHLDLPGHKSYVECLRRFVAPDASLIGVLSQNKLSLSRLQ